MKIQSITGAVVVAVVALTTSCSSSNATTSGNSSPTKSGTYTVGISWSGLNTPYFTGLKKGVDDAVKSVAGLKIISVQANNDANTQLDQLAQLVSQHVDLIVVNPADASTIASGVQQAIDAKIPIMTLDRMIPSLAKNVVTHVGASAEEAGYNEAQLVCNEKSKQAKILGIWGLPGNQTTRDRVAGVKRGMTANGCALQLVAEVYEQGETTEAAAKTMGDWLQKYAPGSIDAVVTYADSQAAGALGELKSQGRTDMVVTGAANFGPFHDAICAGNPQAFGTVDFNTEGQGKTLIDTIVKYRAGEKLPAWVTTPQLVVTPKNKLTCAAG